MTLPPPETVVVALVTSTGAMIVMEKLPAVDEFSASSREGKAVARHVAAVLDVGDETAVESAWVKLAVGEPFFSSVPLVGAVVIE